MKLVTFASTKFAAARVGVLSKSNKIFDLTSQMRGSETVYRNMINLVESYQHVLSPSLKELNKYIETPEADDMLIEPRYFRILAPIKPRRNVMCIGKNYADHVKEISHKLATSQKDAAVPVSVPVSSSAYATFFTKAPDCIVGHNDTIPNHTNLTKYLDYEVELAVIIGTTGRDIKAVDAWKHVMGFTIANDITARDIQKRHNQWFKGKTLDGSCPLG
jgi:2-keto-4-pentenoate hydratase/2-oxohepta-3-ene-1,7-dioic acid hydratase in catechol pathway